MEQFSIGCSAGSERFEGSVSDESGLNYSIELYRHEDDHPAVRRLRVTTGGFSVEVLPTKGLSVRSAELNGRQYFWESPLQGVSAPSEVRLNEPLIVDGEYTLGMSWIRYFSASIEMLGLVNWGMPAEGCGLHGNASNIPINEVVISSGGKFLDVRGSFIISDADGISPAGEAVYLVEKTVRIYGDSGAIQLCDRITNSSKELRVPQWGYHVQLRPDENAEYLIPGRSVEERFGGRVPPDHRQWKKAEDQQVREEKGFIYKKLLVSRPFPDDESAGVTSLLQYRDGSGIAVSFTPPPYLQSWFSCGGGGGRNFMEPATEPFGETEGIFRRNWDGVGPEFGNTALDRNGNTDPEHPPAALDPGESTEVRILVRMLDSKESSKLRTEIETYCVNK